MKALASMIMRSRGHAMLTVAVLAMVTLMVPLLGAIASYLCAAAIGLVMLRHGVREGAMLLAVAVLVLAVLTGLRGDVSVAPSAGLLLIFWVLLAAAAWVLRATRSLPLSLLSAAAVSCLFILGMYVFMDSPSDWWRGVLGAGSAEWLKDATDEQVSNINQALDLAAKQMTGFIAVAILVNTMINLFIARWWQALLYNPGGFREEFHQLRFVKPMAIAAPLVVLLALLDFGSLSAIAKDLLYILVALYVLQALSIGHAVIAKKKLHVIWLLVMYLLLLSSVNQIPIGTVLLTAVGYMDTWLDFRRRFINTNASS